jgi:tetratricopeptide (TPR) repeat protein
MIQGFVFSAFLFAATTMDTIKNQFLEKNVAEAVFLLKSDHQQLLKSASHQQQVAQWLSTFQYDSTLSLYEKSMDLLAAQEGDKQEAEKNVLLALEREPHNTKLLTHIIAYWLGQKNISKAREKIKWAQKELPFMEIYKVYGAWLDLHEAVITQKKLVCSSATLLPAEKDFCQYVYLLELVSTSKGKRASAEVMKAFQKTTILNKHAVIWKKWQNAEEKQKYSSSCRTLSDKQKKAFLIVPEFCNQDEKTSDKETHE